MLIRRLLTGAVVGALLATFAVATPASADEVVYCPAVGDCIVIVTNPGGGGTGGGSGTGGNGPADCGGMPCYRPDLGWFNPIDRCYYRRADPAPPAGHPSWQGHEPGDGDVYLRTCTNGGAAVPTMEPVWIAAPPPGFGGLPSPAVLAAQAINRLPIRGPDIGIAPDEAGSGLVGLPVWMWTAVTPQTWGPATATASVPGLSVTATAKATMIVWSMGDGQSVTCANPGTPYQVRFGNTASPTCGYRYTVPGDRYTITASTTWQVTWAGGGASGELTVTRQSSATIRIDELQVVTG